MQILPTSFSNSYGFFSSADTASADNFLTALDSALEAVNDSDYHSATAAMQDQDAATVESPYTRHTTDGVTYTLDEVCFTKNELEELRKALLKEGAPEEALQKFDLLVNQPDGATLAQVIASLISKTERDPMSEDDAHAITALLGQLDPTGQLGKDAIDFMNAGNSMGALDLIQNALAKMDPASGIDVDAASLGALGRGLGLNADSMRAMLSGMGGRNSLTLNNAQFNQLINPAKNFVMTEAANAEKLDAALEKTIKGVISKARNRMEKEKAAAELQNRRVEQSKILIDRTVQQRSRDTLNATLAGESEELSDKLAKNANNIDGFAAQEIRDSLRNKTQNKANVDNSQPTVNEMQAQSHAEAHKKADVQSGSQNFNQDANKKDDGWDRLLSKVSVKEARPVQAASQASSVVYSMLQGNAALETVVPENIPAANIPQLPQMVANQVETGMLTNLRNGATRMELQLHPAELGVITVTLLARNGEITAQLRSEKSETAEMLTRQLDTMRVNLEEQGLKVDKIEVQLENQQDAANQAFEDLNHHNARQQENTFRQEIRRLRNLAGLRNSSENSVLAQDVHSNSEQVRYPTQSLHVVA